MAKSKMEPNAVGFGVGNTGKAGSTNLHPGAPNRSKANGRAFFPTEPTQNEKNHEAAARVADKA